MQTLIVIAADPGDQILTTRTRLQRPKRGLRLWDNLDYEAILRWPYEVQPEA